MFPRLRRTQMLLYRAFLKRVLDGVACYGVVTDIVQGKKSGMCPVQCQVRSRWKSRTRDCGPGEEGHGNHRGVHLAVEVMRCSLSVSSSCSVIMMMLVVRTAGANIVKQVCPSFSFLFLVPSLSLSFFFSLCIFIQTFAQLTSVNPVWIAMATRVPPVA